MREETTNFDRKSLLTVVGKTADFDELAKDCVAFANAKGGHIHIGIENNQKYPPVGQKIPDDLPGKVVLRISQLTINTQVTATPCTADNGADYIDLNIQYNVSSIAGTTDGKYYIRIGDQSVPLHPDQLMRLLNDKPSFNWELIATKVPAASCDSEKKLKFLSDIRESPKVSDFIKEKTDEEILEYYSLTDKGILTNLGVLWIGTRKDRSSLNNMPVIQFIKYDERGEKVNKIVWDDHTKNPAELIDAVWKEIPDWKEGIELPHGLKRDFIPNYSEKTIRELITNSLVHRPYTTSGDIFINLYPDRVEIHNPGTLPVGVTPQNLLHESRRRNEHLCKIVNDLGLMEREGSGYDLIYDDLLTNGKQIPLVEELDDRLVVTVSKLITSTEAIRLIKNVSQSYKLSRKERIALGLIAQHQSLTAIEFNRILDLKGQNASRAWLENLIENDIIKSKGKTRGTTYSINPQILKESHFKQTPILKNIEPYRLRELIYEDLTVYPNSSISEINERIGKEISRYKIREQLKVLLNDDRIDTVGRGGYIKYVVKKGVQ